MKCIRCGKELPNWAFNAKYCWQCRKEVDDELYRKQYEKEKALRKSSVLWMFADSKININWLCRYLWLGSNTLYSKLNQWQDLTLPQKAKASEWFDEKIRLLIKCKLRLDRDIEDSIDEDIDDFDEDDEDNF